MLVVCGRVIARFIIGVRYVSRLLGLIMERLNYWSRSFIYSGKKIVYSAFTEKY